MKAVRVNIVVILLAVLASIGNAFDTKGKFGMGIRFWGTPIITFSNMRFCLSNALSLEPSLGFHSWEEEQGDYKNNKSLLILSVIGNRNIILAEHSNFLLKLGGAFGNSNSSYTGYYGDSQSSTTELAILFGFGIEHFVNDNFAVNVGVLSGYWLSENSDSNLKYSILSFSNQLVDFSLMWYLE